MKQEKIDQYFSAIAGMDDNMSISDFLYTVSNGGALTDSHRAALEADLRFDAGVGQEDIEPLIQHIQGCVDAGSLEELRGKLNIGYDSSIGF